MAATSAAWDNWKRQKCGDRGGEDPFFLNTTTIIIFNGTKMCFPRLPFLHVFKNEAFPSWEAMHGAKHIGGQLFNRRHLSNIKFTELR